MRSRHPALLRQLRQLGRDFGFQSELFSIDQVITHAKYLQQERARLLFESVELEQQLKAEREARNALEGDRTELQAKIGALEQQVAEKDELSEHYADT